MELDNESTRRLHTMEDDPPRHHELPGEHLRRRDRCHEAHGATIAVLTSLRPPAEPRRWPDSGPLGGHVRRLRGVGVAGIHPPRRPGSPRGAAATADGDRLVSAGGVRSARRPVGCPNEPATAEHYRPRPVGSPRQARPRGLASGLAEVQAQRSLPLVRSPRSTISSQGQSLIHQARGTSRRQIEVGPELSISDLVGLPPARR